MTTIHARQKLRQSLRDKKRRDAFVSAYTGQTIPFQIRALREQEDRGWTQEELAAKAGMKQTRISVLENPNYERYSLKTLKQLASAFDVALMVRFVRFSELAEWTLNLSSGSLEVPSFEQEDYFKEDEQTGALPEASSAMTALADNPYFQKITDSIEASSARVLVLKDYLDKKDAGLSIDTFRFQKQTADQFS